MVLNWLSRILNHSNSQAKSEEDTDTALMGTDLTPKRKRVFGTRDFHLTVVGEQYYKSAVEQTYGTLRNYEGTAYTKVVLCREPDNKFDSRAIRVMTMKSQVIGYLDPAAASKYNRAVKLWADKKFMVGCEAQLVKDKRKPIQVYLDMDYPRVITETFRKKFGEKAEKP